ncbi:hypothetical protein E2C01_027549 [Portunus trituberculatus]|uniref:Uncharacterized protein n=1 Tax=Portunus trituberculatus TaxID=210409 RepID=A0A5B7ELG5_PORTR|nr:hypothetical protein [Portunus trituberculatus]
MPGKDGGKSNVCPHLAAPGCLQQGGQPAGQTHLFVKTRQQEPSRPTPTQDNTHHGDDWAHASHLKYNKTRHQVSSSINTTFTHLDFGLMRSHWCY